MKVSKVQKETLDKMEKGKWYSAYDLDVSMSTMEALLNRGLVEKSKLRPGDMFFSRTSIEFKKVKDKE